MSSVPIAPQKMKGGRGI